MIDFFLNLNSFLSLVKHEIMLSRNIIGNAMNVRHFGVVEGVNK